MKPDRDDNGLPLHSDECPDYDGKRCSLRGFRPDRFCEPKLIEEYVKAKPMTTDGPRWTPGSLAEAIGEWSPSVVCSSQADAVERLTRAAEEVLVGEVTDAAATFEELRRAVRDAKEWKP
jgi:hypothetical protein